MAASRVIDDDGVIVWESMAIDLYLAKKAGGALAPMNRCSPGRARRVISTQAFPE